jgi:hypothetical protein
MPLTAADVQEAARTGADLPGLPLADLVKLTRENDWDGSLYTLKFEPASQIAAQVNASVAAIESPKSRKALPVGTRRTKREAVPAG